MEIIPELQQIERLLESFLGPSKDGIDSNTQLQFNCPMCAMEKGIYEGDGKYNLEVNIQKNIFRCWACSETHGMSGRIPKLILKFGNERLLKEYRELIATIRSSKLYSLNFLDENFTEKVEGFDEELISLPDGYLPFTFSDLNENAALQYLYSRNIGKEIINRFHIGYIPLTGKDRSMSGRVVIPSYTQLKILNYWVARDYTGKRKKTKYKNPGSDVIKKTDIVFNESLVNWYEDITLVEGPFDHIVVPNSIPLLGKTINPAYQIYKTLQEKAKAHVNIFLDDDAESYAKLAYAKLNEGNLAGRIRFIRCPEGLDAALIFQKYGQKGIRKVLRSATKLSEFELSFLLLDEEIEKPFQKHDDYVPERSLGLNGPLKLP